MSQRKIKREIPKVWGGEERERAHHVFLTLWYTCSDWKVMVVREQDGPETSLEGTKMHEDLLRAGSATSTRYLIRFH